jgi:hypothetical protein
MRQEHSHALITLEWRGPGQQLVGHARQRILIRTPVHRPALDLLRRRVTRSAQELPGTGQANRRHCPLAHPEIRQVHVIGPPGPRIHQDVRRLDITVY